MSDYKFERLTDTNLKDLLFLYKTAFNENESLGFLQKKYDTAYTGVKHVGYIAYSKQDNSPAAYYGVFPVKLIFEKKSLLAAQSGDTMTHPDHRGKGLFVTLAKMTYELAQQLGVEFVFGFPNDNSYPGFVKKLNWDHYSNVNHYKIKASAIPLDKLVKKFSFLKPIHKLLLAGKSSVASELQFENSLGLQNSQYGMVSHDSHFFKYKTYYPSFVIELAGVKCWVKIDGRLWVGDIEFCDEQKFDQVIEALISYAKKKFCASVQFSFFEGSSYDLWMKKKYASHSTIAVGAVNLSMKYDPTRFAYQAGDFDTY